jgi:predicted nucleic acid-binding protein
MTGWLLDTDILSELRRPKPQRKVVAVIAAQPLDLLFVDPATLAELRFGIEIVPDPSRRAALNDWLRHKVRPIFEQRVLTITEDVMFRWRLIVEDGRRARHTFSQPDLIIAATAFHHGLTVVPRDITDFASPCSGVQSLDGPGAGTQRLTIQCGTGRMSHSCALAHSYDCKADPAPRHTGFAWSKEHCLAARRLATKLRG